MPRPCTVVALGGNALLRPGQRGSYAEQLANLERVVPHLARLARARRLVLTHGNGPQVGDILLQQELAKRCGSDAGSGPRPAAPPAMPLSAAVAMSQGFLGALLQEALGPALHRARVARPVVTVVTQVLVDPRDPAFQKPTKPIGPFYPTRAGLPAHWALAKTAKGWRRLVPSPEPKAIIEAKTIQEASAHSVVIACGGGGIPVARTAHGLRGIDAVIDKDRSAVLLARAVRANELIILTDVDAVCTGYGTRAQKPLRAIRAAELRALAAAGQFPAGSMGPKVEAALRFLRQCPRGRVLITSFSKLEAAFAGRAGTCITA